jgi:hypothetical protein
MENSAQNLIDPDAYDGFVGVDFVRQQNVAQMASAEDYDMIDAFPPN